MSELTLDQLSAGIQAQFGAISDDISLLRAQVKQVRDTFLRSTLTDVETTVNTVNTNVNTVNTTTGTINTTTGTINTTVTSVENGLGTLIPDIIHPGSACSIGPGLAAMGVAVPASATWGVALQTGIFIPFYITVPQTVYKFFAVTGTTAAGNEDIGIYDKTLTKIISTGSTAQAAGFHVIDVADTALGIGNHYLGITQDNATSTYFHWTLDSRMSATIGVRTVTTDVHPLPTTVTFSALGNSVGSIPVFGAVVRNA